MINDSFYLEIKKLIDSKREGQYWDFKRKPHEDNNSLLHDILCLANAKHQGDRFLIIGVADPSENCEIIGLDNNTTKRKKEADLNDFLSRKDFAGGHIPKINIKTLNFNNKEIDVIIIKNSDKKPFYLEKGCGKVEAYHIYTRTGDRNTPKNENASLEDIEYMWKERFGLHLNVDERFKLRLNDIEKWNLDFGTNKTAFYLPNSDFSIELSEWDEHNYVEPFNTFYLDNSLAVGDLLFKYKTTTVFKCEYAYCDGLRILIPVPKLKICKDINGESLYFYYYNLNEFEGLFAKLISRNTFSFRGRPHSFPFIVVNNKEMLIAFVEYLENNIKASDITCNMDFNLDDPNNYNSPVNLESLVYIKSVFDEWKQNYTKI